MLNVCGIIGFTPADGGKAFALAELLIALHNISLGSYFAYWTHKIAPDIKQARDQKKAYPGYETYAENYKNAVMEVLLHALPAAGLILQGIIGLLLYPLVFMQKMISFCWAWIILAALNILILFTVGIITIILADTLGKWRTFFCLAYLLYNFFGILVMLKYITTPVHHRVANLKSNPQVEEEALEDDADIVSERSEKSEKSEHHHHHHLTKKKKRKETHMQNIEA